MVQLSCGALDEFRRVQKQTLGHIGRNTTSSTGASCCPSRSQGKAATEAVNLAKRLKRVPSGVRASRSQQMYIERTFSVFGRASSRGLAIRRLSNSFSAGLGRISFAALWWGWNTTRWFSGQTVTFLRTSRLNPWSGCCPAPTEKQPWRSLSAGDTPPSQTTTSVRFCSGGCCPRRVRSASDRYFPMSGRQTAAPLRPHRPPPPVGVSPLPTEIVLDAPFPNPFNPETAISFYLPENEKVQVRVIDLLGRVVRVYEQQLPRGFHEWRWDGRDESGLEVASKLLPGFT